MSFSFGDKVTYTPEFGDWEIGVVRSVHPTDKKCVFVVYKCNGNWEHFYDYTAALTNIEDLKLGWSKKESI